MPQALGRIGFGWSDGTSTRSISFTAPDRVASGTPDADSRVLALSVARAIPAGGFTFTPEAGVEVRDVRIDGFTETGANALNLRVGSTDLTGALARLAGTVSTNLGAVTPRATVGWRQVFGDDVPVLDAAFSSGARFRVEGTGRARGDAFVALGLDGQLGPLTLFADYEGDFGSESHGVRAGTRISW
jgi:outer membrane autotransporter protein